MRKILVACPQPGTHSTVQAAFGREAEVTWTSEGDRLPSVLGRKHYDLVLLDIGLLQEAPEQDVEAYRLQLDELKQASPSADIVLLASREQHPEATKALQAGAASYVSLPLQKAELLHVANKLTELARKKSELDFLRSKELETDTLLPFKSKAMQEVYTQVKSIADTKTTTLLVGETGVGKGVIARLMQRLSRRKGRPFISLHCGAIPETLFESELFGHEKGAFPGPRGASWGSSSWPDREQCSWTRWGTSARPSRSSCSTSFRTRCFSAWEDLRTSLLTPESSLRQTPISRSSATGGRSGSTFTTG